MAVKYKAVKDFNVRVERGTVFSGTLKELLRQLIEAGAVEKVEEAEKNDGK